MEKETNVVLPVVVVTMFNRERGVSYIEKNIFNSPRVNKGMHMLSPAHIKTMKKLPF